MGRRITTLILLASMVAYGGGIARALHHVTAHGCDHGQSHCHLAELVAASHASTSCCGHSHSHADEADDVHHHHAHSEDDDCGAPADEPTHDHDCNTCDMLMSIAASVQQEFHCTFAPLPVDERLAPTCTAALSSKVLCSGGPRAPPAPICETDVIAAVV